MDATLAVRAIIVADLEESVNFYREVFGFQPTELFESADPALSKITQLEGVKLRAQLMEDADGIVLELVQFENPEGYGCKRADTIAHYGLTHLAFIVDDVDATRALVIASGGHALDHTRVLVEEGQIPMDGMFVSDPNGVRIEIADAPGRKVGFLWNGINVKDLQKSIDYYRIFGFEPVEQFNFLEGCDWVAKLNELNRVRLRVQVIGDGKGNAIELIEMQEPVPATYEEPRIYNAYGIANLAFFTDDRDKIGEELKRRGGQMFDTTRVEIDVHGKHLKQWHGLDPNGVRVELVQHPQ